MKMKPMIDEKIKRKEDCTGCYACSQISPGGINCISMVKDNEGFWYPKVDYSKCIKCGLCVDVCPILNNKVVENTPVAYACINKNESIRLESSSGGLFSLIAEQVIDDGGVVFGAGFDENFEVVHSYIKEKNDIGKYRGSKYVQSKIGDTYKQAESFLKSGKKVLFTGTPCQIAGLKSFLRDNYINLLCVDLVCYGVPSPDVFRKYTEYITQKANSPMLRIFFRSKILGWKRNSIIFIFKNNTEYQKTTDKDLYMKAFSKNICLRPSCYDCKFKTLHRLSDITLADFWGIQNIAPEMDDDKGTSLLLINSDNGKETFKKIEGKILYKEVNINEAIKFNQAAIESRQLHPKRDAFFKELNDNVYFELLVKKYCSDKFSVKIKKMIKAVIRKVLKILGIKI
jgi:coenzyme F420-reducing hydrogenase beta subunit